MSAWERMMVVMNEDIIRFCGENVLVFSSLERLPSKVGDYDPTKITLCGGGSDAKKEIELLLKRSRTRQTVRVAGYEARCLLPSTPNRVLNSSSVPSLLQSSIRPRLLQRPQIPRRGEHSPVAVRPLSSHKNNTGLDRHKDPSRILDAVPDRTAIRARCGRRRRNKLGG
ncbi:unnamed protein product [Nippostrongylus brasiliensis]|uniref:LUD_dom domain-containing protein n=1 Tax=Nippostrongylus brasiliensis TaxID=27835 RepID=A0A0N4YV08_NIPBR|nr:unnamed protein product [Nippostrongylus brasiliensis]